MKYTFHDRDNKANVVLERVHSNVCGPFSVASTTRHKYFIISINDFSRKCWIFFMRKKDEIFSKFVDFKALVEKESDKKVKALRSDNGGEYVLNEFKEFYVKERIQREMTTSHNLQHNGVAERKNGSIVGVVRVMLHAQGLPLHS